jgi:hypothetical protein
MKCQIVTLALFLFTSLLVFLLSSQKVLAQTSRVNATVKISICGNEIKESGEECDRQDLDDATCRSLGFDTGTLSCDIACDFEKAECTGVAPSPSPSPSPTPAPSPKKEETSTTTQASTANSNQSPTSQPEETSETDLTAEILPVFLRVFDLNGTGKIEKENLAAIMKLWVDEWKNSLGSVDHRKCDVNNDRSCSLEDFSILLFYVEPS